MFFSACQTFSRSRERHGKYFRNGLKIQLKVLFLQFAEAEIVNELRTESNGFTETTPLTACASTEQSLRLIAGLASSGPYFSSDEVTRESASRPLFLEQRSRDGEHERRKSRKVDLSNGKTKNYWKALL